MSPSAALRFAILVPVFLLLPVFPTSAAEPTPSQVIVISAANDPEIPEAIRKYSEKNRAEVLSTKEFLTVVFSIIGELENVPKSSGYLKLKFRNAFPGTTLYSALQKGVYLDLVANEPKSLPLAKKATEGDFAKLVSRMTGEEVTVPNAKEPLTYGVLLDTLEDLYRPPENDGIDSSEEFGILNDAFRRLRNEYVDPSKVEKADLVRGAIKGMAEATDDPHTVYFPPTESKAFEDGLAGEFEGIGAYVDMKAPGVLTIVSPITGSPAEKAGLKGGDVIESVNGFKIDETVSLEAAVAKIKGPAGTEAKLTILRDGARLEISVTRAKVVIEYVEYKMLESGIPYVRITMFGNGTLASFDKAAKWISTEHANADKLILDLRNNPGGSLEEVASVLSYFVPAGESVVKIRYRDTRGEITSAGSAYPLSSKKTAILVNGGSASASEILAGTIRDYLTGSVVVGETTFGKGSVQSLFPYSDGSSLKYTIAKWYTGRTETGIDGVGIVPDVKIEASTGTTADVQLKKAEDVLLGR